MELFRVIFVIIMKRHLLHLLSITLLVCACSGKKELVFDESIPFQESETYFISECITRCTCSSVNLPDGFFISRIDKSVIKNDLIYLFDFSKKSVACVRDDGATAFIISRFGRGPEEYLDMKSAAVDQNDIIILDNLKREIHRFNRFDGSYVGSSPISFTAWDLECFDDGTLIFAFAPMKGGVLASNQPYALLLLTDRSGHITDTLLPHAAEYYEPLAKPLYFRSNGKHILFSSFLFDGFIQFNSANPKDQKYIQIVLGANAGVEPDRRYMADTPLPIGNSFGLLLNLGPQQMNYFIYSDKTGQFLRNPDKLQRNMLYMPSAAYGNTAHAFLSAEEYDDLKESGLLEILFEERPSRPADNGLLHITYVFCDGQF